MSQPVIDNSSSDQRPADAEVVAELDRILGSKCFEQAGRSSDFLRYVVEQTLAGAADRLKGYTIGIEVFKRPPDFDAQADPLVRVEAGRLRRRLLEYYAAEGSENPLRIELPRGGYTAEFHRREPAAPARTVSPSARGQKSWLSWRRIRNSAVLVALIVLVGLVVRLGPLRDDGAASDGATVGPSLPGSPKILVLPFENLSGDASLAYVAEGITEEIMLRLSRYSMFVIASPTTASHRDAPGAAEGQGAAADAAYVLSGSVRTTGDRARISARLADTSTGAQLWAMAYDEDLSVQTLLSIQEKIASEVAETIAVPYGPIYERELARAERKPPSSLDTYDCMLKYYSYRRTLDPALHRQTVACFQTAVAREPMFASAWGGLALLYLDEYAYGYTPQSAPKSAFERAGDAARTGLDIDGTNYLANLALARVRFFGGDDEGFHRSIERVLGLDPGNVEAVALFGALLSVSGDPSRAEPLLAKTLSLSPRPPGTYYVAIAANELRAGRPQEALDAALRIDAPNWFITPVIVAAAAGLAGRTEVSGRAVARLLELNPSFPRDAHAVLAKWRIDPALQEQVDRGLRAAGLEIA